VALESISYNGLQDIDAQQSILAAWASEAAKASSTSPPTTPSDTPSCSGTEFGMDSKVAQNLANLFCNTADLTKDSSKILGGSDLSPAVTIDKDLKAQFLFLKYPPSDNRPNVCDGTPEGCRQMYTSIIKTCEASIPNPQC
jgi:hypothetical protein